jgi:hypothetical protein
MRPLAVSAITLALLVLGTPPVFAQAPPAQAPAPDQHTTISGSAPDLEGRWFVVAAIDEPRGSQVAFWDIVHDEGRVEMTMRQVGLPLAQQAAIDEARKSGDVWKPTPEDLVAITAAWDSLPPRDLRFARIENEIAAPDGFDANLKKHPKTAEALWVVRQTATYLPTAKPNLQQVNIYAALEPRESGFAGDFLAAAIASGAPEPIYFNGTFRMYRMGSAQRTGGVLGRLLDVFSGCGRR